MRFILINIFLFLIGVVFAQSIENVDFRAEGKTIVVTYDFLHSKADTAINVELVFKDQQGGVVIPKTITGAIKNVKPGESKRIVWDVLGDGISLSGKYNAEVSIQKAESIKWVSIPAGTFMMGSPAGEISRENDETPHQVSLRAFKMSAYEVTFEQYDAFCVATKREKPSDQGWGRGKRPVINVSWDDATAFAKWLDARLPTEAEWEYACRAGSTTPFNTGANLTTNQANYNGSYPYNKNATGIYREQSTEVGSFAPNAYGLYDMHGNVWEWCQDWYDDYPSTAQSNPTGPTEGSGRVFRGGSWFNGALNCRSAFRISFNPDSRDDDVGFRLVSPE